MLSCTEESCEKDCVVSQWEDWGECTAPCGGGMRERTREMIPGTPGGKECPCEEYTIEREYCNTEPCEGVYIPLI